MPIEWLIGIGIVSLAILIFLPKRWRWAERQKVAAAERDHIRKAIPPAHAAHSGPQPFGRASPRQNGTPIPANDPLMEAVRTLEAYATHQGGFDYYFAHIGDESTGDWNNAISGLRALGLEDAARLVEEAQKEFQSQPRDEATQDEVRAYLARMKELDRRWRLLSLDLDTLTGGYPARD